MPACAGMTIIDFSLIRNDTTISHSFQRWGGLLVDCHPVFARIRLQPLASGIISLRCLRGNYGDFNGISFLEDSMKYGVRNNIIGKVTEIKKGSLMSQVKVKVDGPIDISSVMTLDSLTDLGVKNGDTVRVLIKAVTVTLVRE